MSKKSKNECKYEDEQIYKPFDVINKDLDLLLILVLLEAYKEGKTELRCTDFLKGNYWDHDDIKSEIFDTNDHWTIEDMVLGQVDFLVEDQRLGNLVGFVLDNPNEALHDVIFNVTKISSATKEDVLSIVQTVEQITFLQHQDEQHKRVIAEKNPEKWREILHDKSVFISKDRKYTTALMGIIVEAPQHIILKFIFDKKGIEKFEKEIDEYIDKFRNDEFQDELPRYQEKRLYFTQQIENFYRYISKIDLIGDTLNIPFSILSERGFEAVKILKYLEKNDLIEMRWSDEGSWKVKFNEIPITPNSLLGIKTDKKATKTSKLKFSLSFTPQTGILVFKNRENEYKVKIQGQVQKEVLRTIFQNPKDTYTEWSLYDISNILGPNDVDRKAIQNALYNINKKVKLEIPELGKLFVYDQHSVILNEKYVEKN